MYVNMSNELVRSAHGLDINEKRLLMLAVSKLDSETRPTPDGMVARIDVLELVEEFGINKKNAYKQAREAAEHLMNRYIRFIHLDDDGKEIETRMQWVGQSNYKQAEGWIELEFWHRLSPMLFELKGCFTSYKLSRGGALRSIYSWRLFELLMQFKQTGVLHISIDKFAHAMEAPKSLRSNFANIRRRIIEPSIKEIAEKDGLIIKWDKTTIGRKVTGLKFTFPKEQQLAIPLKPIVPKKANTPSDTELKHLKWMAEKGGVPLKDLVKS